jgi:hypothetical protein
MATKLGSNPNGVVATVPTHVAATPLGLTVTGRFSQGSSRLETLGWRMQSLWDWSRKVVGH